jgi:hypothetical protein
MTFFEGTWSSEPDPAVSSEASKTVEEETCAWLPGGRRHMVCRGWSQRRGETIRRERIQVLSYQPHNDTYLARIIHE